MLRYLNMFVLIGIALIGVSLAGFATGGKFLIEPGQDPNPMASVIYLGAGVLMIFNGMLSLRSAPSLPTNEHHDAADSDKSEEQPSTEQTEASVRS
jgi:hypothetical protein